MILMLILSLRILILILILGCIGYSFWLLLPVCVVTGAQTSASVLYWLRELCGEICCRWRRWCSWCYWAEPTWRLCISPVLWARRHLHRWCIIPRMQCRSLLWKLIGVISPDIVPPVHTRHVFGEVMKTQKSHFCTRVKTMTCVAYVDNRKGVKNSL